MLSDISSSIPSYRTHTSPRDPTVFYWFDRPVDDATTSALQCQDFRASERREDDILIFIRGDFPVTGNVQLKVSASNLPASVSIKAEFRVVKKELNWDDELILNQLPKLANETLKPD